MPRRRSNALLRSAALFTSVLAVALASCSVEATTTVAGRTTLVCTTAMIGDVVEEIAADDCDVVVLFGPDVDPSLRNGSLAAYARLLAVGAEASARAAI